MADAGRERLFIAVSMVPTAPLREVLAQLDELGPPVRAVRPEALHLTLRFLGPTVPDRVPALERAMREAVELAEVGPFTLALRGLGRFPAGARGRPRVIYAAPLDPAPLDQLAEALAAALEAMDPPIAPESRPFHAHLTLARVTQPRRPRKGAQDDKARPLAALDALLAEHRHAELGETPVNALELIASELTPAGSIYTPRVRVPLDARMDAFETP